MHETLLLKKLGFIINNDKSHLEPATKQKFQGFILNSNEMKIELPVEKRDRMLKLIKEFEIHQYFLIILLN